MFIGQECLKRTGVIIEENMDGIQSSSYIPKINRIVLVSCRTTVQVTTIILEDFI